jgi:AcrR family transcriptional regulator
MDKAERRLELLRAARDVFATKGYHDAKIDDVVAAAKVAKGTFYLYFPDKRSVFEELVDGLFAKLGAAILQVDPGEDVEAQVKHNIRAIVAVLLDDPAVTQMMMTFAAGLDPAFAKKIGSFYDGVKRLLEESLAEGQKLGIVAEGDPDLLATFTIGALKEIFIESAMARRVRPREEIVTALFVFLERGYLRVLPGEARPAAKEPAAKEPPAKEPHAKRPVARKRGAKKG